MDKIKLKTACVIFSYQAEQSGLWSDVLRSVNSQRYPFDLKLVLDSSSQDGTIETAKKNGWQCLRIHSEKFNHGLTRNRIVHLLAHRGYDIVIFLSQDIVLAHDDTIEKLTSFLLKHDIAGCYGRQVACRSTGYNAWQRCKTYPAESKICSQQQKYSIITSFFSNAFAAWKIKEIIKYGGFPETNFGEDVLLTAKILSMSGKTGYCAEAVCYHDHSDRLTDLFSRGRQIGVFHKKYPEIVNGIGNSSRYIFSNIPPVSLYLSSAAKCAGYLWGRFSERITPWLIFCLMWLVLIFGIQLYSFPQRDIALRYAPMAEAFASGDWTYAFHPRIPPLLPVCAGIISKIFCCNGFLACKIASSLFLTAGIFPLYYGCRRRYGFHIAAISCWLFAFCSYLLRLGYYGVRETGSAFGVLLLFYSASVLKDEDKEIKGYFWFAVGFAMLCCSRGDSVVAAVIALIILIIWDIKRHLFFFRSAITVIFISLLLLPLLYCNYNLIGYPVPELRYAVIMERMVNAFPRLDFLRNPTPKMKLDIGIPAADMEENHE